LPAGMKFDEDTLMLTWEPGFNQAGTYNDITFTATDDGDGTGTRLSVTTTIPIVVRNANRAPEIPEIPNQFVDRNGPPLEILVTSTDADGNPIKLSAAGLPSFGSFVDNHDGTGLFRFTPGPDDRGNYKITLIAKDSGDGEGDDAVLSATREFIVTARAPSDAPHLDWIADKVAVVGEKLRFAIQAHDLDQDELTFSALGLPAAGRRDARQRPVVLRQGVLGMDADRGRPRHRQPHRHVHREGQR